MWFKRNIIQTIFRERNFDSSSICFDLWMDKWMKKIVTVVLSQLIFSHRVFYIRRPSQKF